MQYIECFVGDESLTTHIEQWIFGGIEAILTYVNTISIEAVVCIWICTAIQNDKNVSTTYVFVL